MGETFDRAMSRPSRLALAAAVAAIAVPGPSIGGGSHYGTRMSPEDRAAWRKKFGLSESEAANVEALARAQAKRERKAARRRGDPQEGR